MVYQSKQNQLIKKIASLKDKKGRREHNAFIVEGKKMVFEAIKYRQPIEYIVIEESFLEEIPTGNYEIITVSKVVFEYLSDEATPQGILAVIKVPQGDVKKPLSNAILLDGVSDPGNLGTIIRTAAAAGYKDIYAVNSADFYSPKTVRSLHGFISAVLKRARPHLALNTTLPKLPKNEPYIPKKEDLQAILALAENTQYSIPLKLACYGLRRGEICALEITDLDAQDVIHITKDLVQDEKGNWVKKPPKTPGSVRNVLISHDLAEEIRKQGYIFKGYPGTISNFLARSQKKLGLEHFSIHKLRHLFASILLDKGYDLKTIQELGGWMGSETVSNIYLHSLKLKDEEKRKKISSDISSFFD